MQGVNLIRIGRASIGDLDAAPAAVARNPRRTIDFAAAAAGSSAVATGADTSLNTVAATAAAAMIIIIATVAAYAGCRGVVSPATAATTTRPSVSAIGRSRRCPARTAVSATTRTAYTGARSYAYSASIRGAATTAAGIGADAR